MRTEATPTAGDEARALRAPAQFLELVLQAIPVREVGTAAIVFWHRGAEELYGWPRAGALGRANHELLPTAFSCPLAEIEAEPDRHGRWQGELMHTARDGRRLVVRSQRALQMDERAQPIACLEVKADITEQRHGGRSGVESAPGRGTAFWVTLPAGPPTGGAA